MKPAFYIRNGKRVRRDAQIATYARFKRLPKHEQDAEIEKTRDAIRNYLEHQNGPKEVAEDNTEHLDSIDIHGTKEWEEDFFEKLRQAKLNGCGCQSNDLEEEETEEEEPRGSKKSKRVKKEAPPIIKEEISCGFVIPAVKKDVQSLGVLESKNFETKPVKIELIDSSQPYAWHSSEGEGFLVMPKESKYFETLYQQQHSDNFNKTIDEVDFSLDEGNPSLMNDFFSVEQKCLKIEPTLRHRESTVTIDPAHYF